MPSPALRYDTKNNAVSLTVNIIREVLPAMAHLSFFFDNIYNLQKISLPLLL